MADVKKIPGAVQLVTYYKGNWTQQVTLTSGGDPYDIADATATFILYEMNGTAALTLATGGSGITHTGSGGVITISASNAQIVALATQDYRYELILTLSGGTVIPLLDGIFSVTEDGTAVADGSSIEVSIGSGDITLTLPISTAGPQGPVAGRTGGVLISSTSGNAASTGDSKAYFRVSEEMDGLTLQEVALSCSTAGSSGATSVQIRRVRGGSSADMLSTPLTIDANETDSATAATPAVIDAANDDIQEGDQIHFDLDAISTGALGIYVAFTFNT